MAISDNDQSMPFLVFDQIMIHQPLKTVQYFPQESHHTLAFPSHPSMTADGEQFSMLHYIQENCVLFLKLCHDLSATTCKYILYIHTFNYKQPYHDVLVGLSKKLTLLEDVVLDLSIKMTIIISYCMLVCVRMFMYMLEWG